MHPSVVSIHRTLNPNRSFDLIFWTREAGLLVKVKERKAGNWVKGIEIAHGSIAWAQRKVGGNRLKVVFDEPSREFVFPETFLKLKEERREKRIKERRLLKILIDCEYRNRDKATEVLP